MFRYRICKYVYELFLRNEIFILFVLSFLFINLKAQDIEKLKDQPLLIMHGGLNTGYSFSKSGSSLAQMNSSMGSISGTIDFTILGTVNIPFSFYLGSQNKSFSQPSFRQFGLSPRYRWITLHLGYRNINFSNYSLNGLSFFGAASEISFPGNFVKLSLMAGRFRKQVASAVASAVDLPGYERRGYGGKIEIGSHTNNAGIILFKSNDVYSGPVYRDSSLLHPAENLVLSINTAQSIKDFIFVSAEYTLSFVTNDARLNKDETMFPVKIPDCFIKTNLSSHTASVLSLNMEARLGGITAGMSYLHIDPEFSSFGCTYINSGLVNYLFHANFSAWKNRISLASQLGLEESNQGRLSATSSRRIIGSAALNISITKNLQASLQYSNFSITNKPTYLRVSDSIVCMQTSENKSLNFNFSKPLYSISLNTNFQEGKSLNYTGTTRVNSITRIGSLTLMYNLNLVKLKQRISSAFNYNSINMGNSESRTIGPSINLSQNFLAEKLNLGLGYSYLLQITAEQKYPLHCCRMNLGFRTGKLGALYGSACLNYRYARTKENVSPGSTDARLQLNYSISF